MDFLTNLGVGFGISVISLCALRTWRARSWGAISRVAHLKDKTLDGQIIVITGGNTGLGFHAAEDFARRGAGSVILACRSTTRGNEAAIKIRETTGFQNIEVLQLDLANLENVKNFSQTLKEKYSSIDCLVCNAGVWFPMDQNAKTEDNLEINTGVNHLGHFLLTNLLISNLKRVVIVSSGLMMSGKIDMDDSRQFIDGRKPKEGEKVPKHTPIGYCDSKLMNSVFARELAERHQNLSVVCIGPGWCKTQLARNVGLSLTKKILMAPFAFLFMRTSQEGAQNIIHAVLEEESFFKSGYFYRDFFATKENQKVDENMELSPQFWTLSEEVTKLK